MAAEEARGRRRFAARIWLAGTAIGLLLTPGFNVFETPAPETVEQVLKAGRLSFDRAPELPTAPYRLAPDGRYYTIHELGTVVLSLPAGLPALWAARATGVPFKRAFEFTSALASAAVFGLVLVALLWDLRRQGVDGARGKAAALLALVLSSQYLVYLGFAVDVSMSAALIVLLVVAWRSTAAGGRRACLVAGLVAGLLVLVKISNTFVLLTAVALLLLERGRPRLERLARAATLALGAAPFLAAAGWWNEVRKGAPWRSPFPECHDWELELLGSGIFGSLVSPVKGMLLFTPALLLLPAALWTLLRERGRQSSPLGAWGQSREAAGSPQCGPPRIHSGVGIAELAWGQSREAAGSPQCGRPGFTPGRHSKNEALLVVGSFALTFLRLAPTECWHSAAGWGIRYYVPWIPALMLVLARGVWWRPAPTRARRLGRAALLAAGLVVNLAGLLTNFHYRRQLCGDDPWNPRGSAPCAVAALPANLARAAGVALPEVVVPRASHTYVFVSNRLTVWWYAVRVVGVPAWASWAIGLALLAVAVSAWRSAFPDDPAAGRARLPATPAVILEGDA